MADRIPRIKSNSSIGGFTAHIWKFVIQGICICISPSFENAKREVREECRRLEILLGFWQGLNTIADSSIKEASNRLLIYQLWTWWICVCFNLSTVWRHSRALGQTVSTAMLITSLFTLDRASSSVGRLLKSSTSFPSLDRTSYITS